MAEKHGPLKANKMMAEESGKAVRGIGTMVYRMRERGFLAPYESRVTLPKLTPKSQAYVDRVRRFKDSPLAFTVEITVNTKVEALAELWDVIQQLEHWDERKGEPFNYQPARLRTLGEGVLDDEANKGNG